jgi:hypothetical protein
MTIPTHTNPIAGTSSDEVIADAVICMNILLKRDYLLETATDESYIAALNNIFVGCEGWHDNITWPTEPS